MSAIIDTFCIRSGIASGHSLNHMAFCLLAGVPHLWLRIQTARATEFICCLNSRNSAAGSSTLARLCAFTKSTDPASAVRKLVERKKFPTTNAFRLGPTLKYLKDLGIRITSSSNQKSADVASVVLAINSTLNRANVSKVIVYTDGSTSPNKKSPNSGCGIFITDEKNKPLWTGGLVVRTDGNNFIAELAAASITVKACPPILPLLLRIDSITAKRIGSTLVVRNS